MSKTPRLALPIIFLLTLMAINAIAQDTTKKSDEAVIKVNPASKARIEFVSDTWDFGSIPRGAIVLHSFIAKNVGTDTLAITNVKPTCGCTTAPLSDSLIPPGGQATIMATFNTQKFNGRVKKQIFVDSSDPIKPYLKVAFSATINNPLQTITSTPVEADFGTVKANSPAQIKITITNNDSTNANLAIVEQSMPSMVKASLVKTKLAPKGTTELVLELQPQEKPGTLTQSITLEAGNIADSRFTIPWKAVIAQ